MKILQRTVLVAGVVFGLMAGAPAWALTGQELADSLKGKPPPEHIKELLKAQQDEMDGKSATVMKDKAAQEKVQADNAAERKAQDQAAKTKADAAEREKSAGEAGVKPGTAVPDKDIPAIALTPKNDTPDKAPPPVVVAPVAGVVKETMTPADVERKHSAEEAAQKSKAAKEAPVATAGDGSGDLEVSAPPDKKGPPDDGMKPGSIEKGSQGEAPGEVVAKDKGPPTQPPEASKAPAAVSGPVKGPASLTQESGGPPPAFKGGSKGQDDGNKGQENKEKEEDAPTPEPAPVVTPAPAAAAAEDTPARDGQRGSKKQ